MFKTILSNFHLEKIFWTLKKKALYIFLSTAVLGMVAGAYASITSTSLYMAQISFYVYSNPDYITDSSVNIGSSDITQAKNLITSYMQILKSRTFLEKVKEETGLGYSTDYLKSQISASAIENTAAFVVRVVDQNPVNAMNIANAIGELAPNEIIRIVKSGGIEVLDEAELPTVPYQSTSVLKYAILGAAAGFLLAAAWFLLRSMLDTTVRRKYEIEDLFTIPILGDVPQMEPAAKGEKVNKILHNESPFAVRESYNSIRAKLLFTGKGEKCPVYAITSADPGEGKTLTCINLASAYAQLGKKILLIDADMRKSNLKSLLDIEGKEGLSEYLAGITKELKVYKRAENLYVAMAGEVPPNPAELLSGERWSELLEKCKEEYDCIFVDLPPAGIVADALVLAATATAYILVVREGVTKFDREQMIVQMLEPVGANICGFVFNGISMKSQDYHYKHYAKDYKY